MPLKNAKYNIEYLQTQLYCLSVFLPFIFLPIYLQKGAPYDLQSF